MNSIICQNRITIIAEMAQAYEGSLPVAKEIARNVCVAGVDAVMFQVVYADELAVPSNDCYNLFQSLELSIGDWGQVIQIVHDQGGLAIGEVFGKKAVNVVLECGIDGFKIHAADINNVSLLSDVGTTNLPILLSVGGSSEHEIKLAIEVLVDSGNSEIVLMHGYQLCPTLLEDTHVMKMAKIAETFNLPVGYADHISGCINGDIRSMNPVALNLPILAIGAGAKVIEKHVILNRTRKWEDYESALTPEEFAHFVTLIREMESALGAKSLLPNDAELSYRTSSKKYLVASQDIQEGTILKEEHIAFKRIENPEEGIVSQYEIMGKRLRNDVRYNDVLRCDLLI